MINLVQLSFYLIYMGLDPAKELYVDQSGAFKSGSKLTFANRAFVHEPTTEVLQKIKEFYGPQPHTLWANPADQATKKLLSAAGYSYSVTYPIMVADLTDIPHKPLPAGIAIKQMQDTQTDLELWLTTLAQAYNLDKEEFRKFLDYFRSTPAWKDIRLYVAYLDGVPAATSMVILHDELAGLHWVGTIPQFRGHGLGTVVSSYSFQELEKQGVKHAVLLASEMGKPVYEKIGFKTIDQLDVYKPQNP